MTMLISNSRGPWERRRKPGELGTVPSLVPLPLVGEGGGRGRADLTSPWADGEKKVEITQSLGS